MCLRKEENDKTWRKKMTLEYVSKKLQSDVLIKRGRVTLGLFL